MNNSSLVNRNVCKNNKIYSITIHKKEICEWDQRTNIYMYHSIKNSKRINKRRSNIYNNKSISGNKQKKKNGSNAYHFYNILGENTKWDKERSWLKRNPLEPWIDSSFSKVNFIYSLFLLLCLSLLHRLYSIKYTIVYENDDFSKEIFRDLIVHISKIKYIYSYIA